MFIYLSTSKRKNMTKRKIEFIFVTTILIFILGLVIVYFGFPNYIGENETDLLDIVPIKIVLYFSILTCCILIYLHLKFGINIFESRVKNKPTKQIVYIILYPVVSIMISYMILFDLYSCSNYCFTTDKQMLTGMVYKMNITHSSKGPDKYYMNFSWSKKYRLRVSRSDYLRYKQGDKININVYKGRFLGYYLNDELR